MTVLQFPTGKPIPISATLNYATRAPYTIQVTPLIDGSFDWEIDTEGEPDEYRIASDLASIALSLRPPKRTFLERLAYLFTGDRT